MREHFRARQAPERPDLPDESGDRHGARGGGPVNVAAHMRQGVNGPIHVASHQRAAPR